MPYYLNYANQSIETPSITSLPKYVKCLMHTGIENITLDIGDMDKTVFNALVDEIRLYFCEHSDYKHIGTFDSDRSWTNPYYFHIPGQENSVISFEEYEDKLEIKTESIDKVISLMDENDIMVNEIVGDAYGLRGVYEYEQQRAPLIEKISAIREAYNSI